MESKAKFQKSKFYSEVNQYEDLYIFYLRFDNYVQIKDEYNDLHEFNPNGVYLCPRYYVFVSYYNFLPYFKQILK